MYTVRKRMLFKDRLAVGESIIMDNGFVLKKAAIKNAKKFTTIETVRNWINQKNFKIFDLFDEEINIVNKINIFACSENLYKFERSPIIIDRGNDSPLSIFICHELGEAKFVDDEYAFWFDLQYMYTTIDGELLIDKIGDWTLAIYANTMPENLYAEVEKLTNCIYSDCSECSE